jgi:hypothetical protein
MLSQSRLQQLPTPLLAPPHQRNRPSIPVPHLPSIILQQPTPPTQTPIPTLPET